MKELIEHITGKRLMEMWGKDEHELLQIVKSGLFAYKTADIWEPDRMAAEYSKIPGIDISDFVFKPDYIDKYHNIFRLAYPEFPEEIPSLIFKLSDIEFFEAGFNSEITEDEPEVAKESQLSLLEKSQYAFCLKGDRWEVRYKGKEKLFNDLKGIQYYAYLLRNPGVCFLSSQLAYYVERNGPDAQKYYSEMTQEQLEEEGLSLLNPYIESISDSDKQKIKEIICSFEDKLFIAKEGKDPSEIEKAKNELEQARADAFEMFKPTLDKNEDKERSRITKDIKYAFKKIEKNMPELAEYLKRNIKTGVQNCYTKEPDSIIDWDIEF